MIHYKYLQPERAFTPEELKLLKQQHRDRMERSRREDMDRALEDMPTQ